MYENYLTAALVIYAIDRLVNWQHLRALRLLADEALFPADDPIMTSSIEAFDYEDEEEESVPPNWEYDSPEAEEPPVATPAEEVEEVPQEFYTYGEYELVYDETRCLGLNKSGRQCGQKPKEGEKYCYIHKE